VVSDADLHPFDRRDIHPSLPAKVKRLFDDGHYEDATFTAWKYLDKLVQRHSKLTKSGFDLMTQAFGEPNGPVQLNASLNVSEVDEQNGYKLLFSGSVWAIRNPRGHEVAVPDDLDSCLDYLSFASMLIRRLEQAGFK
jgi:uncharacterized protein (TIGR02391 family)